MQALNIKNKTLIKELIQVLVDNKLIYYHTEQIMKDDKPTNKQKTFFAVIESDKSSDNIINKPNKVRHNEYKTVTPSPVKKETKVFNITRPKRREKTIEEQKQERKKLEQQLIKSDLHVHVYNIIKKYMELHEEFYMGYSFKMFVFDYYKDKNAIERQYSKSIKTLKEDYKEGYFLNENKEKIVIEDKIEQQQKLEKTTFKATKVNR